MAYLNTIPAAPDILALSQAQMLENFSQLEIQIGVDHSSLLAGAATGWHDQVTLPEYVAATYPTTALGQGALFTMDSGTQPEAYYREESDGTVVQLTSNGTTYIEDSDYGVRAYGVYSRAADAAVKARHITNIVRVINTLTVNLDITMADTNYAFFYRSSADNVFTVTKTNATTITMVGTAITAGSFVDVMVLGDTV